MLSRCMMQNVMACISDIQDYVLASFPEHADINHKCCLNSALFRFCQHGVLSAFGIILCPPALSDYENAALQDATSGCWATVCYKRLVGLTCQRHPALSRRHYNDAHKIKPPCWVHLLGLQRHKPETKNPSPETPRSNIGTDRSLPRRLVWITAQLWGTLPEIPCGIAVQYV